jgi:hypothetical protein
MRSVVVIAVLALAGCTFEVTGLPVGEPDIATGGGEDLAGVDLTGVDLTGADLSGSDTAIAPDLADDLAMPDLATLPSLLTGQVLPLPMTAVVLTTEGSQDWAHYGLSTTLDFDHRALGGTRIPNFEKIGNQPLSRFATSYPIGATWSDGTPTLSATATQSLVYTEGLNTGFRWIIACENVPRVARFYLGGYRARGRLDARVNDNSAAYTDSSRIDTNGSFYAVYRLDYRCATGKSLEVTWRVGEDHGAGGNLCDVRVASVTLQ